MAGSTSRPYGDSDPDEEEGDFEEAWVPSNEEILPMESNGHQFEDADNADEFGFIPRHEAHIDVTEPAASVEVTEEQVQAETLGKLLALMGGGKDDGNKWPDIVLTVFGIGAAGILSLHGDHGMIAVAILVLVAARGR